MSHTATAERRWASYTDHVFAITFTHTALRVTRQVEPQVVNLDVAQVRQCQIEGRHRSDNSVTRLTISAVNRSLELNVVVTTKNIGNIRGLTLEGYKSPTVVVGHIFFETELTDNMRDLWHVRTPVSI